MFSTTFPMRSGAACPISFSVLAALASAPADPARSQEPLAARVATCLDRARPALLHHLRRATGGSLALCCLAAHHDDVPRDEPVFAAAIDRLARTGIEDTYGLALRLMVMAEMPDFPDRDELARRDAELLAARQTTGGFSYHPHDGWWDLSNTQYAALGLRAAAALGVEVPRKNWQLLYQALCLMQHDDGGFTYRPGQGRSGSYASMTVAGIAVLQVCAQFLELSEPERKHHDERVALSWQWLAGRKEVIGDRRTERCYYFLYGLERAAILSDLERVGDVDWYAAGAAMLCDEQKAGGGFWGASEFRPPAPQTSKGHPVDTAFAILFLRRRFQKFLAPVPTTGVRAPACAALPASAGEADVRAAAERDAARGRSIVPGLLRLLHSDVVARRQAALLALHAIAGQDFGIQPYRNPREDAAAIRRAELWWLRERGRQPGAREPGAREPGASGR